MPARERTIEQSFSVRREPDGSRPLFHPGRDEIVQAPGHWPALPMTEVVLIEADTADRALAETLLTFLIEGLRAPEAL